MMFSVILVLPLATSATFREISFVVASVLLLAYRFLKELRTSVRLVRPKPAAP